MFFWLLVLLQYVHTACHLLLEALVLNISIGFNMAANTANVTSAAFSRDVAQN